MGLSFDLHKFIYDGGVLCVAAKRSSSNFFLGTAKKVPARVVGGEGGGMKEIRVGYEIILTSLVGPTKIIL